MTHAEITEAIIPHLKHIENPTKNSVSAMLSQILQGKKSIPPNWEQPLYLALKVTNREEFKKQYPLVKFFDETPRTKPKLSF